MFEMVPYWTQVQEGYDLFMLHHEVIYQTIAVVGVIWWWLRGRKIKSMKRELKLHRELMRSRDELIDALQHREAVAGVHKKHPDPGNPDLKMVV